MESTVKKRGMLGALFAFVAAVMLSMAFAAKPAYAAYDQVSGPSNVEVPLYVVTGIESTSIPSFTPKFQLKGGSEVAPGEGELAVKPGHNIGSLKINDRTRSGSTTSYIDVPLNGGTSFANSDPVTSDTTKKHIADTLILDFSSIKFSSPGVYRYHITESSAGNPGMTVRNGYNTITIDIYVENGEVDPATGNQQLVVVGQVIYKGEVTGAPGSNTPASSDKAIGFVNDARFATLKISKKVEGNLANFNQDFVFNIVIDGITTNSALTQGDADPGKTKYAGPFGAPSNGKIDTSIYLKHNQQIVLVDIPVSENATYKVTETPITGFTISGQVSTPRSLTGTEEVVIINKLEGSVPTGVLTALIPGIILVVIAALVLARRKIGKKTR